jgi:hypothetical protein
MTELAINVPESLFGASRKAPHEVAREMRIAAAIHWYQQGALSMERAAEPRVWIDRSFWPSWRVAGWMCS